MRLTLIPKADNAVPVTLWTHESAPPRFDDIVKAPSSSIKVPWRYRSTVGTLRANGIYADSFAATDKSAWWTHIIDEVTWVMDEESIEVDFVSGERARWPFVGDSPDDTEKDQLSQQSNAEAARQPDDDASHRRNVEILERMNELGNGLRSAYEDITLIGRPELSSEDGLATMMRFVARETESLPAEWNLNARLLSQADDEMMVDHSDPSTTDTVDSLRRAQASISVNALVATLTDIRTFLFDTFSRQVIRQLQQNGFAPTYECWAFEVGARYCRFRAYDMAGRVAKLIESILDEAEGDEYDDSDSDMLAYSSDGEGIGEAQELHMFTLADDRQRRFESHFLFGVLDDWSLRTWCILAQDRAAKARADQMSKIHLSWADKTFEPWEVSRPFDPPRKKKTIAVTKTGTFRISEIENDDTDGGTTEDDEWEGQQISVDNMSRVRFFRPDDPNDDHILPPKLPYSVVVPNPNNSEDIEEARVRLHELLNKTAAYHRKMLQLERRAVDERVEFEEEREKARTKEPKSHASSTLSQKVDGVFDDGDMADAENEGEEGERKLMFDPTRLSQAVKSKKRKRKADSPEKVKSKKKKKTSPSFVPLKDQPLLLRSADNTIKAKVTAAVAELPPESVKAGKKGKVHVSSSRKRQTYNIKMMDIHSRAQQYDAAAARLPLQEVGKNSSSSSSAQTSSSPASSSTSPLLQGDGPRVYGGGPPPGLHRTQSFGSIEASLSSAASHSSTTDGEPPSSPPSRSRSAGAPGAAVRLDPRLLPLCRTPEAITLEQHGHRAHLSFKDINSEDASDEADEIELLRGDTPMPPERPDQPEVSTGSADLSLPQVVGSLS